MPSRCLRIVMEALTKSGIRERWARGSTSVEVEATWGIYEPMIAAYGEPSHPWAREQMHAVIDALTAGGTAPLVDLRRLGRTLARGAADVLAGLSRPRVPQPHHYIARAVLETCGFRPQLHPAL